MAPPPRTAAPAWSGAPESPVTARLGILMVTAFLDMVGGLIILPLVPFYAQTLGADGLAVAVLTSAFSAGQLASAPLWGRMSDGYGRKPALLGGLGLATLGYVLFARSDTYAGLLLSRLLQGAGGGTAGVIQAYVADTVAPKHRARALGWLSAATNAGLVIGPLIGAASAGAGAGRPGGVAAVLCAGTMAFAWKRLPESRASEGCVRPGGTGQAMLATLARVTTRPGDVRARLIWAYAVGMGAFYGVTAVLVLLLERRYGVTARTVGYFFAYMGVLSIAFRVGVLGRVVDAVGEQRTARLGAVLLAVGLVAVPFLGPAPLLGPLAIAPLALAVAFHLLGAALLFPSVSALLTGAVGERDRGMVMGVQQTYGGLARVVYPIWAGFAWDRLGEGVAFWTSGVLVAVAVPLALRTGDRQGNAPDARDDGAAHAASAIPE